MREHTCAVLTCSVKGVVGVEDCGEEAEGESANAEGHVKARVPETLEHLRTKQKNRLKTSKGNSVIASGKKRAGSLTPPRLSGSVLCP